MAHYFFDTSALAKRYLAEPGSSRVLQLMDPTANHRLWIARIAHVEMVAAITRRERMGLLATQDVTSILAAFDHDRVGVYRTIEVTIDLIEQAMVIARQQQLRAYDAVQLASASQAAGTLEAFGLSLTVVCADSDLSAATERLGISVEVP